MYALITLHPYSGTWEFGDNVRSERVFLDFRK